jgi:hypothetical protein
MAKESEMIGPERTFVIDDECLGVDVRGCELVGCDTLRIRTYRPRRGGDYLSAPPEDFTGEEGSLRFPHCPERLSPCSPESPLPPGTDLHIACFDADIHDIGQYANLSKIRFLLIPCSALEAAKIPGFERGCIP